MRFLLRLAELELIDRERRMVERRIRAARFPAVKSFDTFDFAAIPSLNKPLTLERARCEYVVAREIPLARAQVGIALATAVMYLRILAIIAVFNWSLAARLTPSLFALSLVGFALAGCTTGVPDVLRRRHR